MLVIDINVIPATFNVDDISHKDFAPIRTFVLTRRGMLVIGGSKYLKELSAMPRYLKLISELEKVGQITRLDLKSVDDREAILSAMNLHPDFDDPHIVAMIGIGRVRVIASRDRRSFPFLKNAALYPAGCKRPKIYQNMRNQRLLDALVRA